MNVEAVLASLGIIDRIRVLAWEQALQLASAAEINRRLGLLERREALTKLLLPDDRPPLDVWQPGDDAPDDEHFQRIAWLGEKRWRHQPLVKTAILLPTPYALRTFGGYASEPRDDQLSHDIEVGGLWVRVSRETPELGKLWVSEDLRKRGLAWGEKLPDAVFSHGGTDLLAWEQVGCYQASKLKSLHDDLESRPLSYVLW